MTRIFANSGFQTSFAPADTIIRSPTDLPQITDQSKVRLRDPEPVRNQGHEIPCCVSCALVACMEMLDAENLANGYTPLSVLYHYYKARSLVNRQGELAWLTFQLGFGAIIQHGVAAAGEHPSRIMRSNAFIVPTSQADTDAANRKIARTPFYQWKFRQLQTRPLAPAWRAFLISRSPIALAFWLTDAYTRITPAQPEHARPSPVSTNVAHAVVVCGYDDTKWDAIRQYKGAFLVKDSRGPTFGNQGYWWLPYYLVETDLVFESWTIGGVNY